MGRSVNAQENSDSDYVKAVYEIGEIVQTRQSKLWLQPDAMFKLSKLYKSHQRCIEILHGFSYRVIRERKEEIKRAKLNNNNLNLPNNNKNGVESSPDDE
ncbi:Cytochrome P450 4c3, partial [Pseudolycoriella hygida]